MWQNPLSPFYGPIRINFMFKSSNFTDGEIVKILLFTFFTLTKTFFYLFKENQFSFFNRFS